MVNRNKNGREEVKKPPKPKLNLTGLLGIAIFFYFSFDLILGDYDLKGSLLRGIIAILGLVIPLVMKATR